jgi:hypothetical protein
MEFPNDWQSPKACYEEYPNLWTSMDALRWELRFRGVNGLLDEGVVVERKADPDASRPQILMSMSRYLSRLRNRRAVG